MHRRHHASDQNKGPDRDRCPAINAAVWRMRIQDCLTGCASSRRSNLSIAGGSSLSMDGFRWIVPLTRNAFEGPAA
jgi:hypothetical protein